MQSCKRPTVVLKFFLPFKADVFATALDAQLSDFEFPDDFVLDVRYLMTLSLTCIGI